MLILESFFQDILQSTITLFVVLHPFAAIPFFQGLTSGATESQKRTIAKKSAIIVFILLIVFAYLGDAILMALHITLNDVMIAGGIFIIVFAVKDVATDDYEVKTAPSRRTSVGLPEAVVDRIAVVPIAIPLLAGPGAIATVMVLNDLGYATYRGPFDFSTALAVVINSLAIWLLLSLSSRLSRVVKPSILIVLGKVMDILMGAIGVSYLVKGAAGILGLNL